jgi:hypothetical protein
MNERNVNALYEILREEYTSDTAKCEALAIDLASRGVLVPSALTDAEQTAVVSAARTSWDGVPAVRMGVLPERLERIAKGEA